MFSTGAVLLNAWAFSERWIIPEMIDCARGIMLCLRAKLCVLFFICLWGAEGER